MSLFDVFNTFMNTYDFYPHPVPNHPGYMCDRLGNVYKPNGQRITPFESSGYDQVYMRNDDDKRSIKGVHQVVMMTFGDDEYYPGCVVHHKDENKKHNTWDNLEVESRSDHSRHHADPQRLRDYIAKNGPANKGKTMDQAFRDKCRISALNRKR